MQIYGDYDVVVVGGGVSGCAAAIASARFGASTILIERTGAMGGMMNVSGKWKRKSRNTRISS